MVPLTKSWKKAWVDCQCFANISTLLCLYVCYVTSGENRTPSWNHEEHSAIVRLQIIHGWSVRTFTCPPQVSPHHTHVNWKLGLPSSMYVYVWDAVFHDSLPIMYNQKCWITSLFCFMYVRKSVVEIENKALNLLALLNRYVFHACGSTIFFRCLHEPS